MGMTGLWYNSTSLLVKSTSHNQCCPPTTASTPPTPSSGFGVWGSGFSPSSFTVLAVSFFLDRQQVDT